MIQEEVGAFNEQLPTMTIAATRGEAGVFLWWREVRRRMRKRRGKSDAGEQSRRMNGVR
jgi:hypothetical protein